MKRIAALFPALSLLFTWSACGGSGTPTTPPAVAKNRAFISNTFSGNLQIVDTQNDTTPFTAQTTNSKGKSFRSAGDDYRSATSVTFEVESPDHTTTLVYDPTAIRSVFITNSTGDG